MLLALILLAIFHSLTPRNALSASLEWDSQLLRFIMTTNLAVEQKPQITTLSDAENERASIPEMPSATAQLDIFDAPSETIIQTKRS